MIGRREGVRLADTTRADKWAKIQEQIKQERKQAEHYLLCCRQEASRKKREPAADAWLLAVRMVEDHMNRRRAALLRLRREAHCRRKYYKGKEVWMPYVQNRYMKDEWIGERTIRTWWHEIVDDVVNVHIRMKEEEKYNPAAVFPEKKKI